MQLSISSGKPVDSYSSIGYCEECPIGKMDDGLSTEWFSALLSSASLHSRLLRAKMWVGGYDDTDYDLFLAYLVFEEELKRIDDREDKTADTTASPGGDGLIED